MLEEDDGGAVVAGALAEANEALLDVLAAAAGGPVEVHYHQRARGLGPLQVALELLLRLELRHAVHRAELLLVVVVLHHGGQAREGPVRAPGRRFLFFAAALSRRGSQAAAAEGDPWKGKEGGGTGTGAGCGAGGEDEEGGKGEEGGDDHGCILVVRRRLVVCVDIAAFGFF